MSEPDPVSRAEFVDVLNKLYSIEQSIKQPAPVDAQDREDARQERKQTHELEMMRIEADRQVRLRHVELEENNSTFAFRHRAADVETERIDAAKAADIKARFDAEALGEAAAVRFHELEMARITAAHCERLAEIDAGSAQYGPLGLIGDLCEVLGVTPIEAIQFVREWSEGPKPPPTFGESFGKALAGVLPALAPFVEKYMASQRVDVGADAPADPAAVDRCLNALIALDYRDPEDAERGATLRHAEARVGRPRADWTCDDLASLMDLIDELIDQGDTASSGGAPAPARRVHVEYVNAPAGTEITEADKDETAQRIAKGEHPAEVIRDILGRKAAVDPAPVYDVNEAPGLATGAEEASCGRMLHFADGNGSWIDAGGIVSSSCAGPTVKNGVSINRRLTVSPAAFNAAWTAYVETHRDGSAE